MNKYQQQILENVTDHNALALIQMLRNELKEKDSEIAHLNKMLDNEQREAEREAYGRKWKEENFEKWCQNLREVEEYTTRVVEEEEMAEAAV